MDPDGFARAARWFEAPQVRERALELSAAGQVAEVERLLLAFGHLQATQTPKTPERVLDAHCFGERFWKVLGMPRARLVRVCTAAARCSHALTALQGSSLALSAVRRKVWAVCFGQSLFHALHLEQVIRDHDVLILGETGTGKELVARAIQAGTLGGSDGSAAPAGAINAAAVPETLIESELFGHVKGAFTGAIETRTGRLRNAHRGSFFLDEVGDLNATTQVALLRVIETDEIGPLGSDKTHRADIRYVAATHEDLAGLVEAGKFRQDLFQRLAGNVITVPPLRERPEDVIAIGEAFVQRNVPVGSGALDLARIRSWLLESAQSVRAWVGNVRELQNDLRDLMLGLTPRVAGAGPLGPPPTPATRAVPPEIGAGAASLDQVQRWYLEHVLSLNDGSISAAARTLGVDRTTVYRWLKQEAS